MDRIEGSAASRSTRNPLRSYLSVPDRVDASKNGGNSMRPFQGKLMVGDEVILSPVEGYFEYFSDSVRGSYKGEIHVARRDTSALHKADRLDIDGGPMFDISISLITASSHMPTSVAVFQSNGIPLRQ
jgi:hypothetical protein